MRTSIIGVTDVRSMAMGLGATSSASGQFWFKINRTESVAQARLDKHLSWRNFDAKIRDARKVRWEQGSGDRMSSSGDASLLSWSGGE